MLPFGARGIFLALPFAIWFYLALEGVAMSAEEVEPKRGIPKGLCRRPAHAGRPFAGHALVHHRSDAVARSFGMTSPLPRAMAKVLSPGHPLTHMMIYIGLFRSFGQLHGIMMGYSRQVFALARAGYLPPIFARLHPRRGTPIWAVIGPAIFGLGVVWFGDTNQAITLAAVGATLLYVLSMISLFVLRRRAPDLERPYRAPFYPVFPAVALLLATICLIAVLWSAPQLAAVCWVCSCSPGCTIERGQSPRRCTAGVRTPCLASPAHRSSPVAGAGCWPVGWCSSHTGCHRSSDHDPWPRRCATRRRGGRRCRDLLPLT